MTSTTIIVSTAKPAGTPLATASAPSTFNTATTSTTAAPRTFTSTSPPTTPAHGNYYTPPPSSPTPPPPPQEEEGYGWTQVTNVKKKQYSFPSAQTQPTSPARPRNNNKTTNKTTHSNSIPLDQTGHQQHFLDRS